MARCEVCGHVSRLVSTLLGVCVTCLRAGRPEALARAEAAHHRSRRQFSLPPEPPTNGTPCGWCTNNCRIPSEGHGYCGVRRNLGGTVRGGTPADGLLSWYYDPLPTNCVADWVCACGSGVKGKNLAVFYESCSFDCLFCQNWHYRERSLGPARVSADALADAVDAHVACICYFGGDPATQMGHALAASRLAIERAAPRTIRICWETNGSMSPAHLQEAVELSLATGGCIKFDLKAWSPGIHRALCGVGNERTLENFAWVSHQCARRPHPPLLVASTLLIPGYVDATEVASIAHFIAELDPDIPYSLLGFHPDFLMGDLPATSRRHADECLAAARAAGLPRLHLGNPHVLGWDY